MKLGFRAHYPQLETKLVVRGTDMDEVRRKLQPVQTEVRKRLGNFIMAEDDQTLEGVVLAASTEQQATLRPGGDVHQRPYGSAHRPFAGAEHVFRRGIVVRDRAELHDVLGLPGVALAGELDQETTEAVARAARTRAGATHALVVLIDLDAGRGSD